MQKIIYYFPPRTINPLNELNEAVRTVDYVDIFEDKETQCDKVLNMADQGDAILVSAG